MLHIWIGHLGHFFIIIAFTSLLLSIYSYWKSGKSTSKSWHSLARLGFGIHSVGILGAVLCLFFIIYNHYYEYHYAWNHSSNNLPVYYMISCFWEGQEGSFLLWMVWHIVLGWILIRHLGKKESSVMLFFGLVQLALVSMILGVLAGFSIDGTLYSFYVNNEAFKIGSNPFILLRNAIDAPILHTNPNYIPEDGTGLNPLLQNYWMVIHPPTLFLGFACTTVPFALCLAGLYRKDYKTWIKPALIWSLITALILGIGVMMGAYWAYETLNFGGYWNWDPVENAVYIPWLIIIAAIHSLLLAKKNKTALRISILLIISAFIFILYATFLTRSGILGETSVHAFTDLGLSGQLIFVLIFFIGLSVFLVLKNWKFLEKSSKNLTVYQADFWVFLGITTLFLMAFQVLIPISIPVYNSILAIFNIESNLAPPTDQITFYNTYQLYFALALALFSGLGQFFWWQKVDKKNLKRIFSLPLMLTFILCTLGIMLSGIHDWKHLLLLIFALFALLSNTYFLIFVMTKTKQLSAGTISHIGIALMLVGILFSGGYDKIISLNVTGRLWNKDFPEEMNKENLLLFRNEARQMQDYFLTYKGKRMRSKEVSGFIDKENLIPTDNPYYSITTQHIIHKGDTTHWQGDTLQIYNENTYYEIEYKKDKGKTFTLYPRIQDNPSMGFVVSPDIKKSWHTDIYTHLTSIAVDDNELEWSQEEEHHIHVGDTLILNDYIVIFKNVERKEKIIGVPLKKTDYAFTSQLQVLRYENTETLEPVLIIRDNQIGSIPAISRNAGLKIVFDYIDPETGTFSFTTSTTQKDWVILKAVEKPLINLVWLGTLMMAWGMLLAIKRKRNNK